ncbi:unnamed protein product [Adineta ricciae]|uniref:G-protein coupled receptors family 1 profile domain-containing protein n=1 Tax=Adineta ricciae TaxID=249248 RepID=A0A814Q4N6_ADIRI|nr:unnamed protein product [Adineta ricciae]
MADYPAIQNGLNTYMPFILLISGSIGNILNCLIFTRSSLRNKPCSIYFLAMSIANLITLYFSCLTRILLLFGIYVQPGYGDIYCRFRVFLTYMPLSASSWFIVAACVDRYASSSASVRIRSFSQLKVSLRIVCGTWVMLCLIWMEMFICFNGNLNGTVCAPVSPFCNTYNSFSLLVFFSLLPPICMLLFGGMTIRNVRHRPINRAANTKDRQLALMLIVQVVIFQILSLPISIQRIYSYITINDSKTLQRRQLESLLIEIVNFAAFTNTVVSFYLFTLTGSLFRKELKSLLFFSKRRQANIEPLQTGQRKIQIQTVTSRQPQATTHI